MTAEIVNLRQARKTKARAAHAADGDANRAKHGRTKLERETIAREAEIATRFLDGHRLTGEKDAGRGDEG